VYLYTQIVKNFSGHAPAFFETMRRAENADAKGLRIATLDIGGGTTDLVITEFTYEGSGNAVTIFPDQLFREGFNVAGDDLVYRIVQTHVLDRIEQAVEDAGVSNGRALTVDLFGGDWGGMDVSDQVRRQQFALQVATPAALCLLSHYEAERESGSDATTTLGFDDIFTNGGPSDDVVNHLNNEVEKRGGTGFDLRQVTFPVDLDALEQTARSVLQPILDVMAEIAWRYRCDLMLVSGRPSRLPMVRASLEEALPMMVGRIVPLHRFRAGHWYPFRDHEARIDDPKTTAAVGAMICALAEGGIQDFNFRSDKIRNPKSTARYIGKLDGAGRIPEEDTYYANIDLEDAEQDMPEGGFEFRGVTALGFRQFPNAWWPATRLYTLDYRSEEDRRRLHPKTPIQVTLKRGRSRNGEQMTEAMMIDEARDSDGRSAKSALTLKLQTLSDGDGYWLDTGILRRS
ncbi:MAG: virulence factor SrfB, partial [Rhodospirillales bacterium]